MLKKTATYCPINEVETPIKGDASTITAMIDPIQHGHGAVIATHED